MHLNCYMYNYILCAQKEKLLNFQSGSGIRLNCALDIHSQYFLRFVVFAVLSTKLRKFLNQNSSTMSSFQTGFSTSNIKVSLARRVPQSYKWSNAMVLANLVSSSLIIIHPSMVTVQRVLHSSTTYYGAFNSPQFVF